MEINKETKKLIQGALKEDFSDKGDLTTLATVLPEKQVIAYLLAKEDCVCAGLPVACEVFMQVNKKLQFKPFIKEGDICLKGTYLAEISGQAQAILSSERVALNFLQRLSGIATQTKIYVDALGVSKIKILDTRKTTPCWRHLEKYAVKIGGGVNHRFGLYDRIMIKDNHCQLNLVNDVVDIQTMVSLCREKFPYVEIEVEADTLQEVKQAVMAKVDYILLDNMTHKQISQAIKINQGIAKLEVSGGITLEQISSLANFDIDFISVGALTHSVKAIDISLDIFV